MSTQPSLHQIILDKIGSNITSLLNAKFSEPQEYTSKQLLSEIFANYREVNGQPRGIRLSYMGNKFMARQYDNFTYRLPERPTHRALVALDSHMSWPYYVSKLTISFYSENDAAWYKLNGGDLNNFVDFL